MKTQLLLVAFAGIVLAGMSCKKTAADIKDKIPVKTKMNDANGAALTMTTININSFPRDSGETDDQPRISRALASMVAGDILQLNSATYSLVSSTTIGTIKSGITIQGVSSTGTVLKVNNTGWYIPFYLSGLTNVTIKNLKVQGYTSASIGGQSLVWLVNSHNCTINGLRLDYSGMNGLYLSNTDGNTSTGNIISNIHASNCFGTGIGLHGTGVTANTFSNIQAYWCRIGISLNGVHHNTFNGYSIGSDCRLIGFAFDGTAAAPVIHPNNNTVANILAERNGYGTAADGFGGPGAYGGVYIGGHLCYGNIIKKITAKYNKNNGVLNRDAHDNTIDTLWATWNDLNGYRHVNTTQGNYNWIGKKYSNVDNNKQSGIRMEGGTGNNIGNTGVWNYTRWNKGYGIFIGAAVRTAKIYHMYSGSNVGTGVYCEAGGDANSNLFDQINSTGNTGGNYFWGTLTRYWYWP